LTHDDRGAGEASAATFLLDVGNTLLDNDAVVADLECYLQRTCGAGGRERYWLWKAVEGRVLVCTHRVQMRDDVERRNTAADIRLDRIADLAKLRLRRLVPNAAKGAGC
jgi:hypothetical protein